MYVNYYVFLMPENINFRMKTYKKYFEKRVFQQLNINMISNVDEKSYEIVVYQLSCFMINIIGHKC